MFYDEPAHFEANWRVIKITFLYIPAVECYKRPLYQRYLLNNSKNKFNIIRYLFYAAIRIALVKQNCIKLWLIFALDFYGKRDIQFSELPLMLTFTNLNRFFKWLNFPLHKRWIKTRYYCLQVLEDIAQ